MAVDRSWHRNPLPHRRLHRGMRGADIRRLQRALRKRIKNSPFAGRVKLPRVDGVLGDETAAAWFRARWALGLPAQSILDGHPLTIGAQKAVRWPWTRAVAARRRAKRRRKRLAVPAAPRVIDARLGLWGAWGGIGRVTAITGHHSAGPTDDSDAHALQLVKSFSREHASRFRLSTGPSDGLGYHLCLTRAGSIVLGRPFDQRGAHVGGANTGNIGVLCHGTTGDRPTAEQRAAWEWWLERGHTNDMPASHRLPRPARELLRRGHNDWPGHESNSCPGTHKPMYVG